MLAIFNKEGAGRRLKRYKNPPPSSIAFSLLKHTRRREKTAISKSPLISTSKSPFHKQGHILGMCCDLAEVGVAY